MKKLNIAQKNMLGVLEYMRSTWPLLNDEAVYDFWATAFVNHPGLAVAFCAVSAPLDIACSVIKAPFQPFVNSAKIIKMVNDEDYEDYVKKA